MTGDQPSVALVSGEAGIGKTRLVGELLATLPPPTTTLGRDGPAGLAGPSGGRRGRPGRRARHGRRETRRRARSTWSPRALERGPAVLVVEDLHWIDAASANVIDRIAQQTLAATRRDRDLPPERAVPRPARRRAGPAARAPPRRRAGSAGPARSHRGRRSRRRDPGRSATVGRRRGASTAAAAAFRSSSRS